MSKLYSSFDYVTIKTDGIKLSPSGLSKFRSNPKEWLNDINGNTSFHGNKATVQGTCVHYIYEQYGIAQIEDIPFEELDQERILNLCELYIDEQEQKESITETEAFEIKANIRRAYDPIVAFIKRDIDHYTTIAVEEQRCKEIITKTKTKEKYYIGGTFDAIVKDRNGDLVLRDYKTASRAKKSLDTYLAQLMSYDFLIPNLVYLQVVVIVILKTKVNIEYITTKIKDVDRQTLKELLNEIVITHNSAITHPKLSPLLFREGVNFLGQYEFRKQGEKQ